MFDIPQLLFFQSGNPFTGSRGLFRFRIVPGDGVLSVQTWKGPYCFEKSEVLETAEFPLDGDGRTGMIAWLEQQAEPFQED